MNLLCIVARNARVVNFSASEPSCLAIQKHCQRRVWSSAFKVQTYSNINCAQQYPAQLLKDKWLFRRSLPAGKGRSKIRHASLSSSMVSKEALRPNAKASNAAVPAGSSHNATSPETDIRVFTEIEPLRKWMAESNIQKENIALVPTMGALHDGHTSLIRAAASAYTEIIVSIYVNPTQFGVNEDLGAYPRTFEEDMRKIGALNSEFSNTASQERLQGRVKGRVVAVFVPSTETMYPSLPPTSEPAGHGSFVTITPIANPLEGASRPVFFRGVATVCMKLFNIIRPDCVVFGEKDAQQLSVIRRMAKDFFLNIKVLAVPTEREPSGLAMSSRNVFLGPRRAEVASVLSRALAKAKAQYDRGLRTREDILGSARRCLDETLEHQKSLAAEKRALFELDYLSMANHEDMQEVEMIESGMTVVVSLAVKMPPAESPGQNEDLGEGDGRSRTIRLIDNVFLQYNSLESGLHSKKDDVNTAE